jgi:large subunit ribosomal protein L23
VKDPRDVLLRPVVSEKSYRLMDETPPVYTFYVHPDATKPEIRDAVSRIFGVRVVRVNTMNRGGKNRRDRRTNKMGKRPDRKRAMVTLAPGDSIDLYGSA